MNVRASKSVQRPRQRPEVVATEAPAGAADYQVQVALAAYFIAEKRGFEPGHELDDWLAAEAQIAAAGQPSISTPIQTSKAESIA